MKLALHYKIIIGLLIGIIWAVLSSYLGWSTFTINWIAPFGTIFIRLLKLIAVPLVLFSIISGVAGLGDPSRLGRMGGKTLLLYLCTTVLAVGLGLLVVNIFKPGKVIDADSRLDNRLTYELWAKQNGQEIIDHQCLSCLPENAQRVQQLEAHLNIESGDHTIKERISSADKTKDQSPLQFLVDMVPDNIFSSLNDNSLMLQVIVFALFFGIAMLFLPEEQTAGLINVINAINHVFLKMVDMIMKASPFFVFALLAGVVSNMAGDNPAKVLEIFKGLSLYTVNVIGGLALMLFVVYPILLKIFVRRLSYGNFFRGMGPAQMLAFSTSSSAATLPVTMECVEDNIGVHQSVTSFVLPIGATVNMDGTSLYQGIAVIFLAQIHMIDLTLGQQLTIVLTATLASIGAAAVPSAGIVMLIIVLQSVGLNPAWIGIVLPVDRILDMCRTVVNITSDATVATIVAKSEGELSLAPEVTA